MFALMFDASEVDAFSTVLLVFALMLVAREVDAFSTVLLVFALTDAVPAAIDAASDVEALPTMVSVLVLTAEVIPEV